MMINRTLSFYLDVFLIVFLLLLRFVDSDHFLGGTIHWQIENVPHNNSWIPVRLTQIYWWTYSRAACTPTNIATNQSIIASAYHLSCIPSCPTNFGPVSTLVMCKNASIVDNSAVGERSDVIWTPVNSLFSVVYRNGNWQTLTSGGGGVWSVLSYINLVRRPGTGLFNNAPTISFASPLYLYLYQPTSFKLSVTDSDGDEIQCRWAVSNNTNNLDECGSVCASQVIPEGLILHSDCTIEIQSMNISGTYVFAIMVIFVHRSSNCQH